MLFSTWLRISGLASEDPSLSSSLLLSLLAVLEWEDSGAFPFLSSLPSELFLCRFTNLMLSLSVETCISSLWVCTFERNLRLSKLKFSLFNSTPLLLDLWCGGGAISSWELFLLFWFVGAAKEPSSVRFILLSSSSLFIWEGKFELLLFLSSELSPMVRLFLIGLGGRFMFIAK